MTTLEIKITKEVLEKSQMCSSYPGRNCAIALAVRDIFPGAWVSDYYIAPFYYDESGVINHGWYMHEIDMPIEARSFINVFDKSTPIERINMDAFSFHLEIPDEVIERINIDELKPLLVNHPTLAFV